MFTLSVELFANVPTYTYTCTACNDVIEKRQSFSDPPLTTCEQCGGTLRKVIHPVGIVFKGSGWYITDSRASSSSANGPTSGSSSAPASKEGASSDSAASSASKDSGSSSSASSSSSKESSSTSSGGSTSTSDKS